MSEAFEDGLALFKREPELLAVEVWWRANKAVGEQEATYDFVAGYMKGRYQRDEYEKEKRNDHHNS